MNLQHLKLYLVVGVALRGVEVEGEDESCPLEDDRLVVLVLARHVRGVGREPAVLFFQAIKFNHSN